MSGTIQNNLITVRQGDSFTLNFEIKERCKPVNLTGASMLMQVRDSGNNVMFSLSGTPVDALKGKMANGTWTEEDEQEYLALDAEVTAYIEEHYPYPAE